MAYISLYRKYRPQRFADVVGQEHVVQTLQNSLAAGRIANGYLFCGTRGVAKTTIARIFAKCLNCVGPDGVLNAPVAEPCNECVPCRTISAGQCVDVIEMDAASNRSVNDMARIRENVQFGPMENRYKTFIVDEAHQLSADAKDAFLKTLEEPPQGVIFILATTESHAIPITIASRCQQFDFKRGSLTTISSQVEKVVGYEGVTMAQDAVGLIARAAEGSYRDALSLLEQVLAFKRENVTARDVTDVIGSLDGQVIDDVVDAVAQSDAARAFVVAERIFTDGKDTRQFIKTLASRFRDLLYIRVGARVAGESDVLGDVALLESQARRFEPGKLLRMMEILADAERETKFVTQHRLLLEVTLLRLMDLPGSAPAAQESIPVSVPASASASASTQRTGAVPRPARAPAHPSPAAPPMTRTPSTPSASPVADAPSPRAPSPQPLGDQEGLPDQVEFLRSHWQNVINQMQSRSPSGVRVISDARPIRQDGATIALAFHNKAFVDMLENPKRRQFVEDVINKVLRAEPGTYKVKGVLSDSGAGEQTASQSAPPPPKPPEAFVQRTMEDGSPLRDEVIEIFGGRIIEEQQS
ncbi:MAG: DNA polymerase III subunit gamma/tau [Capsulimonadaceae bacterium]|nr:DNA polymerase III subunit gamma/tau [Capsulimonadaceae bacterium]